MINLKRFKTHADYEAYIGGDKAILPNVSYCKDAEDVHYNNGGDEPETEGKFVILSVDMDFGPSHLTIYRNKTKDKPESDYPYAWEALVDGAFYSKQDTLAIGDIFQPEGITPDGPSLVVAHFENRAIRILTSDNVEVYAARIEERDWYGMYAWAAAEGYGYTENEIPSPGDKVWFGIPNVMEEPDDGGFTVAEYIS